MRRNATIFAAMAAMMWMSGCGDQDPVSSQIEGADSPAGKLVISKTKAAGDCNVPGCRPGFGGGGVIKVRPKRKITVDLLGGATMEFVLIDPGTFTMGASDSDDTAYLWEKPQHQVTLTKGFYLGKYEITQGQWEAVMGTRPWEGKDVFQNAPNNAASHISWEDLQPFINKLNEAAGETLYRLPTDAEWEYACRAGTTTQWSFGDDLSQLGNYAWYDIFSPEEYLAHPVGMKLPNPWGLYDMYGNVQEWVQDLSEGYDRPYPSAAQIDPQGPSIDNGLRIRRGGDFGNVQGGLEIPNSSLRLPTAHDQRNTANGARLVRIK